MAYQIQHRRAIEKDWSTLNPILAPGEIGYIIPVDKKGNPIEYKKGNPELSALYKIGDGVRTWNELPDFGFNGNISTDLRESNTADKEVVNKTVLISKFSDIDKDILNIKAQDEAHSAEIKKISNEIGQSSEAGKTGLIKEIDDIKQSVNNKETGIGTLNTKTDKLDKEVFGVEAGPEGSPEKYIGLKERIETLEKKHVPITQSQYDLLESSGQLVEGTFYYIYEESKQ